MSRAVTLLAAIALLGVLGAGGDGGEVRTQLWIGEQGCYGGEHFEFVLRETVTECETGDGGWGRLVELGEQTPIRVRIEWYSPPDEHVCAAWLEANVFFVVTFDSDVDGDVDLADFAEFQVRVSGPATAGDG